MRGRLSVPTSRRRVWYDSSWIRSMSSFRTRCKKLRSSPRILRFVPSRSTTPAETRRLAIFRLQMSDWMSQEESIKWESGDKSQSFKTINLYGFVYSFMLLVFLRSCFLATPSAQEEPCAQKKSGIREAKTLFRLGQGTSNLST